MLTEFKTFFAGARLIVGLAALLAAFGLGVAADRFAPFIGARAQLARAAAAVDRLTTERDGWRAAYDDWHGYGVKEQAAFRASEDARKQDGQTARAGLNEADRLCLARVSAARTSAAAIARLTTPKEPDHDPTTGLPVRRIIHADELCDALTPGRCPAAPGG